MPCNAGNSDYANSVYGGLDQQTAAPGQGNLIQMHNPTGGMTGGATPLHTGGRRRKGKKGSRRGGVGLGQVLVPAGLVLANNYTYKKLRGKKGKSVRRGRGFRPFARFLNGGNEQMVKMGGSNVPSGYSGHSSLSPALVGGEGPNNLPEGGISPNQIGGSTLVDLAVPAGLVYANDRYYNRKRRGVSNRRARRGTRRTRGRRVRGGNHIQH
jgi:hypothetical protein